MARKYQNMTNMRLKHEKKNMHFYQKYANYALYQFGLILLQMLWFAQIYMICAIFFNVRKHDKS